MRLLTFLEYGAIIVGAVGLLASPHFGLIAGSHLGMILIGGGLALGGAESLYSREMSLRFSADAAQRYAGFPSVVWGLMLLAVGGGIIGYAYLLDAGTWPRVKSTITLHPGAIYLVAGLLAIGLSILVFVDTGRVRRWWQTLLFRLPRVLFGVVCLLAGLAMSSGGAWQLLHAQSFATFQEIARMRIEKTLDGHPAQAWFRKQ